MKKNLFTRLLQASLMCCLAVLFTACDEVFGSEDNPIPAYLSMNTSDVTLKVGESKTRTAIAVSTAVVEYSSSDPAIATVDANGTVTGVAAGEAKITATATGYSSASGTKMFVTESKSYKVTVGGGVTSITFDQTTLNKNLGDAAVTLTATVAPTDAPDKSLTWSSDKPAVATVADGVVTFKGPGTAIIKATANDGSGVEAKCTVTVTLPGLLTGKFTVNGDATNNQVQFSKGNLRYTSGSWSFFNDQYGYYNSYSANWDKFGWSTSATTFGMNTSVTDGDYSGDFVDWGTNAISNGGKTPNCGWRTLTSAEWTYLFNTRSATTVNSVANARFAKAKLFDSYHGVILFPDSYTHPDGVALPTGINETDATSWEANTYSAPDWLKMEAAGCVFLPAAGYRSGTYVMPGSPDGKYWSSSPNGANNADVVSFDDDDMTPAGFGYRHDGCSVRLVYDVK